MMKGFEEFMTFCSVGGFMLAVLLILFVIELWPMRLLMKLSVTPAFWDIT